MRTSLHAWLWGRPRASRAVFMAVFETFGHIHRLRFRSHTQREIKYCAGHALESHHSRARPPVLLQILGLDKFVIFIDPIIPHALFYNRSL